ncbi:MAG: hypothetical protein Q9201_004189 [Fulgogasparrea decipioides]
MSLFSVVSGFKRLILVLLTFWYGKAASLIVSRDTAAPKPIVVPASQNFEGIDGPWSSFTLQIGSPAQDVNVFISTAGYQTLAVAPQGCVSSDQACTQSRGGIFNPNQSTSWTPNTLSPNKTNIFTLGLEENLGYSGVGQYGFDTVALGWQGSGGPSLDHQIVATISTTEFYLGTFGSLTLGGYDASRFIPNDLTIPFHQQDIRDLTVNINAISMISEDGSQRTDLLIDGISALIDSTIPGIYLPVEVCQRFEDAFGLEWNETVQGYLVNDTLHKSLKSRNPSIRFTISNSSSTNSPSIDINLPYAAFDLIAEPPLMKTKSRYFPLMRASNESQYTLGRTFLQEAYLIADYERHSFSISQCAWIENAKQDIVAIRSPTHGHEHHLSWGAVAGIVIGCVIAISAFVLGLRFYSSRVLQSRRKPNAEDDDYSLEASTQLQSDGEIAEIDGKHPHGNEIDGRVAHGPELADIHPVGQELDGAISCEMEGSFAWLCEMETKDATASEKPA